MSIQSTAKSGNDETTAAALQRALLAARNGRLQDACQIVERALASGGDPGPLNALLGMLRLDLGDARGAADSLAIAHQRRPTDVRIAVNLANALIALDEFDRALEVANPHLAFSDPSLQLARIRGFAANQLQDFNAAIEALEHVVAAAPSDWESWNNLGNSRRAVGDLEGSVTALKRSVDLHKDSPPSRLNYAGALADAGRLAEAEAEFQKMADDFPHDAKPLRELHVLLKNQTRDDEALRAIALAVAREPDDIDLRLGYASFLSLLLKMEASEAEYRRVIAVDPANDAANVGVALVYELSNRTDELAAFVDEARQRGVSEGALNFIRAFHLRRVKDYAAGLEAIQNVPADLESSRRYQLLGQLLEGMGRYDEAFEAFARMNERLGDDGTMPELRGAAYRHLIRTSRDRLTEEWHQSWRQAGPTDERPSPVFLLGFPRSGTTLLDTILMSHPRIEVLEEEPALRNAHDLLLDLDSLSRATDEQIKDAREVYFDTVAGLTPMAPGNLVVDKNPLTMNLLPLVRRLFPDARVILALRHPCDVVLSCFMANFRLNDGMASFLKLDSAADLYDASFAYYERAQELMKLPTHTVVYENVVHDREAELRRLFDFLELDWHDAVLDHQSTALKRGRIKTASYSQVVEPIYTRSAGRWENYRKHLQPVLPVLRPWAAKFGYDL